MNESFVINKVYCCYNAHKCSFQELLRTHFIIRCVYSVGALHSDYNWFKSPMRTLTGFTVRLTGVRETFSQPEQNGKLLHVNDLLRILEVDVLPCMPGLEVISPAIASISRKKMTGVSGECFLSIPARFLSEVNLSLPPFIS